MDDKITDENNLSSRKPKFRKKVAKKDRIYCQICLVGFEAKHQARRWLQKNSEIVDFKVYTETMKNKNHKYDKAFSFVD